MKPGETHNNLLLKDSLWLGGKVDGDMADYVGESFAKLMARGAPPITVYITSSGGSVTVGLDIYDMLSVYPGRVKGVVAAFARSIAVVILQACTTRTAFEHARILIHHISTQEITLDEMRSWKKKQEILADMEKNQERLYRILSRRTGKPVADIRRTCKKNKDMTAREALAFGLIDDIMPVREDIRK